MIARHQWNPWLSKPSDAPVRAVSGAIVRRSATAARGRFNAGSAPTAGIRSALRALASEIGPQAGQRGIRLLRPLIAQAQEILRDRLEGGGAVDDYLRGRARLADSAVVGMLHIASIRTGIRRNGMVAPVAVVAVGGYGRRELAPFSDLDVLFLLPENNRLVERSDTAAAVVEEVVAGLWDLGFTLDHAARSSRECLALAHDQPAILAGLLDRRFLWGGYGLFAALDADVAGLFSGRDAGRWRSAICAALTGTRRRARTETQPQENEPDVKRDPGGLRDLRRALSINPLASGRPSALSDPTLIEAHRFLWLVRCHLHLLAGHAEDRLSVALQPSVAHRLGLIEPRGAVAAPSLLNHFRHHTQKVLKAATRSAASPLLPLNDMPWQRGC